MSVADDNKSDICNLYSIPNALSKIEGGLYIIDFLAALSLLFINCEIVSIAIWVQILTAFLYFVMNVLDDGCFWYKAEKARRRNAIENGLGIRLSELEAEGYYSNSNTESIEKYALNLLESNLYSKEISKKMMFLGIIKFIIAFIILLLAWRFVDKGELLLIIAQTVFSTYIFMDTVMLLFYYVQMENIYKEGYAAMITPGVEYECREAVFIAYAIEYEAIKAHYKIRLNTKIFEKNKGEFAERWKQILSHRRANLAE